MLGSIRVCAAGKGDEFIQQLLVSDVRSHVNDTLDPKLINTNLPCDTTLNVAPVDKICNNSNSKNQISVDDRTLEDYYFDMGAVYSWMNLVHLLGRISHIRNFNFSNLDVTHADLDPI